MLIQSCPLIAFGETTPELSSQSQNKSQNCSGVKTSTPQCSGVESQCNLDHATVINVPQVRRHLPHGNQLYLVTAT